MSRFHNRAVAFLAKTVLDYAVVQNGFINQRGFTLFAKVAFIVHFHRAETASLSDSTFFDEIHKHKARFFEHFQGYRHFTEYNAHVATPALTHTS
jgi:hypothetical protein